MKIALDTLVHNADDTVAQEAGKDITVRQCLIRAALSDFDADGQPVKGSEKVGRYHLYIKVKKATDETEFEPEEVVALRKAVLTFPVLLSGFLYELLGS